MNIVQLQYFLTIQSYMSFSSAAGELCITQSALSKQIKSLESELNTLLFNRNKRSISLTPAGEEFAVYANKLLANYNEMISNMKKHELLEKGYLSIATIPVMSQYGMTSKIAGFAAMYPEIKLDLAEKENDIIVSMLRNGEVDVAFMRTNYLPEGLADVYPLAEDYLVLVVAEDHPLSPLKAVDLAQVQSQKFIFLNSTSGIYTTCMEECEKAGFTPDVLFTNSRIETIMELVAEKLGVTLLMNQVARYFDYPQLRIVPLTHPVTSTLAVVKPKNKQTTESIKTFMNYMLNSIVIYFTFSFTWHEFL
ncbi:LysR family transcriptional regulator [Paenibacillus sp. MMS20-IR301]|uniref:LysR family transcriptional regulator n=1 Tax=Paenibacillus sp. MMS20-IR301 TaxID=2895946 RepID=UPI0028E31976|nr:LysR family transcriptional regulator [Paenibacillus sp. MMS20-IR301]WNS45583.1 LysR family transcriptional regulator [Paenibacillus sp. MMS20-IR301]